MASELVIRNDLRPPREHCKCVHSCETLSAYSGRSSCVGSDHLYRARPQNREKIKSLFLKHDTDKSSRLDHGELKSLLEELSGKDLHREEVSFVLQMADNAISDGEDVLSSIGLLRRVSNPLPMSRTGEIEMDEIAAAIAAWNVLQADQDFWEGIALQKSFQPASTRRLSARFCLCGVVTAIDGLGLGNIGRKIQRVRSDGSWRIGRGEASRSSCAAEWRRSGPHFGTHSHLRDCLSDNRLVCDRWNEMSWIG